MLRSSKCVLLFQNNNLTSEELGAIKLGLSGVNKPEGEEGATLEMVRGGLLAGVASRGTFERSAPPPVLPQI